MYLRNLFLAFLETAVWRKINQQELHCDFIWEDARAS